MHGYHRNPTHSICFLAPSPRCVTSCRHTYDELQPTTCIPKVHAQHLCSLTTAGAPCTKLPQALQQMADMDMLLQAVLAHLCLAVGAGLLSELLLLGLARKLPSTIMACCEAMAAADLRACRMVDKLMTRGCREFLGLQGLHWQPQSLHTRPASSRRHARC